MWDRPGLESYGIARAVRERRRTQGFREQSPDCLTEALSISGFYSRDRPECVLERRRTQGVP